MRTTLLTLAGLAAALTAKSAYPCAPPPCQSFTEPPSGRSIPANAPAVRAFSHSGTPPTHLTLADDTGTTVPLTVSTSGQSVIGQLGVTLDSSRTYTLDYEHACGQNGGKGATSSTFTVTPARPLPTLPGSLLVRASGRKEVYAPDSSGSCTANVDAAYADLEVALTDAMVPWLEVTEWQLEVDGTVARRITLTGNAPEGCTRLRPIQQLYAACDPASLSKYTHPGLTLGKHTAKLSAKILGTTTWLHAGSVELDLRCDASPSPASAADVTETDDGASGDAEKPAGTGTGTGSEGESQVNLEDEILAETRESPSCAAAPGSLVAGVLLAGLWALRASRD